MTGTRPYHHGDVRAEAVRCTVEAVREHGERAVTIRSIADAIGVSHAALYRHVGSVDELFDEAAAGFLRSLVGGGADQTVEEFLTTYASAAVAEPHLYRLAFGRARDAQRAPISADSLRLLRIHAARVFAAGWPGDSRTATMHRVIRTWSTMHGMLDLAAVGLVVADEPAAFVRYLVRSAATAASANTAPR